MVIGGLGGLRLHMLYPPVQFLMPRATRSIETGAGARRRTRRLTILRFLAEQSDPVLIRDVASGCRLETRQVRMDVRAMSSLGQVRQQRRRGVLANNSKLHETVYLEVVITAKGRMALTEAA